MKERKKILTMLVENNYGVTSRVSGMFSRRGFNLDSFTGWDSVCRELMLVKVRVLPENRQSIMAVSSIFHGKVVDVTRDSMIIELTGKQEKLDAFINLLDGYEILEVASTGLTGLERGSECVVPLKAKSF